MSTGWAIALGAAGGYLAAYLVARGRGQPGAVAPLRPTSALVAPNGQVTLVPDVPTGYDPRPAIEAVNRRYAATFAT